MFRPPRLPREHGAWVMLLLPLVLGLAGGRAVTPASLIIPPAAVLLFLARFATVPGGTRPRAGRALYWAVIYFLTSAAGLMLAVAQTAEPWRTEALGLAVVVGVLGFGNAALVRAGRGRTVPAEVMAMASAALLAPLEMVVGEAPLRGAAPAAGLLCFAYFLSSLVTVRTFRPGRVSVNLFAHAGLTAALVLGWVTAGLPPGLLLAFVPVLVRVAVSAFRPPRHLRALGMRELTVSVALVVIAAVSLRW